MRTWAHSDASLVDNICSCAWTTKSVICSRIQSYLELHFEPLLRHPLSMDRLLFSEPMHQEHFKEPALGIVHNKSAYQQNS